MLSCVQGSGSILETISEPVTDLTFLECQQTVQAKATVRECTITSPYTYPTDVAEQVWLVRPRPDQLFTRQRVFTSEGHVYCQIIIHMKDLGMAEPIKTGSASPV